MGEQARINMEKSSSIQINSREVDIVEKKWITKRHGMKKD